MLNMNGHLLSDLERARLESPGEPDANLVVRLARRAVTELGMEPPISHVLMASMRGVSRVEEADIPWAGCLVLDNGVLVIRLRASDIRGRKRFTAFHEIVHTYLPGFAVEARYRCDPALRREQAQSSDAGTEELCDLGAVEMLLPRDAFLADMADSPPTMDLASRLATRYEASLEATARRIVTLHERPVLLLGLEVVPRPSAPHEEPKLRVQLVHANGDWPFVPRHKSVPMDSPLAKPLSGEAVHHKGTLGSLANVPLADIHLSAVPAPYPDRSGREHKRVLAMISRTHRRGRGHHAT